MYGTMLKVKLWIHLAQMCQVRTNELQWACNATELRSGLTKSMEGASERN